MTNAPKRWETVWITGASSGIGRALAERLCERAGRIAVTARSRDKLDALAAAHTNIAAYPADVTEPGAVANAAAAIERDGGPTDLVVLCAGYWKIMGASSFDRDEIAKGMDVNYMGVVNALAAVLPGMIARRSGHVVIVASVAGYAGLPKAMAYAPTKAALINLAETLKLELEPNGVAVSLVNPGFVDTPMTRDNPFPMPDVITAQEAARHILDGLDRGRFEIVFPWRFTRMLKVLTALPYSAYFAIIRKTVEGRRRNRT